MPSIDLAIEASNLQNPQTDRQKAVLKIWLLMTSICELSELNTEIVTKQARADEIDALGRQSSNIYYYCNLVKLYSSFSTLTKTEVDNLFALIASNRDLFTNISQLYWKQGESLLTYVPARYCVSVPDVLDTWDS